MWSGAIPAAGLVSLVIGLSAACGGSAAPPGESEPGEDGGLAAPDGGPEAPADAGAEARADAAPGGPFCATLDPQPRFCDDFDDGDGENDWTIFTFSPASAGTATLGEDAVSPPYAFSIATNPVNAGSAINIHLRKTLLAPVSRVTFGFAMKIAEPALDMGSLAIATLDVTLNRFFTLLLRDADEDDPQPILQETGPGGTTRHVLSGLPPKNTWSRVTIELDLEGGEASVSFGSTKVLDGAAIQAGAGSEATIRIGTVYVNGPAAPITVAFDDVILDF
jgi:hypothetical protein